MAYEAPKNEVCEAEERQQAIQSRARRSIATLEKSFIRNGSGRYVVLGSNKRR